MQDRWNDPDVVARVGKLREKIIEAWKGLGVLHRDCQLGLKSAPEAAVGCADCLKGVASELRRMVRLALNDPECPMWLMQFLKDDGFHYIHEAFALAEEIKDMGEAEFRALGGDPNARPDAAWRYESLLTQFRAENSLLRLKLAMHLIGLPLAFEGWQMGDWG